MRCPSNDFGPWPPNAKTAKHLDARFYFTGKPCKHGHISKRYTCKGTCVECVVVEARVRAKEDPVTRRANEYKYRSKNRDKISAYHKQMRNMEPERVRGYVEKSTKKHKTKHIARRKAWYLSHKEEAAEKWRNMRARRLAADGSHTRSEVRLIHQKQGFLCAACFTDTSDKKGIDHIVPLSKNGTDWPLNIQILCRFCNSSKGNKNDAVFKEYRRTKLGIILPQDYIEYADRDIPEAWMSMTRTNKPANDNEVAQDIGVAA